jgi:hypothetical protein
MLRFGVRTQDRQCSGTWYVVAGNDSSFYVGRRLGADFKLSFHATGQCNYSITEETYATFEPGQAPPDRYIEQWQRQANGSQASPTYAV